MNLVTGGKKAGHIPTYSNFILVVKGAGIKEGLFRLESHAHSWTVSLLGLGRILAY